MKKPFVIVALYPGCISYEVALAAELLSSQFEVINISPDGSDLTDSTGLALKIHASYSKTSLEGCKAILVPGGDPRSIIENTEIDQILRAAFDMKIVIGAICAGPSILAKAGILKGKKIAHGYNKEQIEFLKDLFKDVHLTDHPLIIEDHLITAKPEAHIDFAVEMACKLGTVNADGSGKLKSYYKGTLGRQIRNIALAIISNGKGQILLHKGFDKIKNEFFYRPLGGGIDFQETGKEAVKREFLEETQLDIEVEELISTFENIFTFEGNKSHEIVLLYNAKFNDSAAYEKEEIDIVESSQVVAKAVWRSLDEIKEEGTNIYPLGIEKFIL